MNHLTKTYVLYGTTFRDPNEHVCQFFSTLNDAVAWADDLPGSYDMLTIEGIDLMPDHITIGEVELPADFNQWIWEDDQVVVLQPII